VTRIQGLARLLVLEKLSTAQARSSYLLKRSQLRGRPNQQATSGSSGQSKNYFRGPRRYKGDLKYTNQFADLEMSDYDIVALQVPYGPGWHAKRIEKLVYKADLGMNCSHTYRG
jgi:hypothetical protein